MNPADSISGFYQIIESPHTSGIEAGGKKTEVKLIAPNGPMIFLNYIRRKRLTAI
jgi:hypothetical protein